MKKEITLNLDTFEQECVKEALTCYLRTVRGYWFLNRSEGNQTFKTHWRDKYIDCREIIKELKGER